MRTWFLMFVCLLCVVPTANAANQSLSLSTAKQQIEAAFARLDGGMKKAAGELGKTGLTGDDARRVVSTACKEFNFASDCCTVDIQGRMTTVEPAEYRRFEGKDISDQEHIKRMLKNRKPVMSAVFRSVEGYDAVDAEYPVFAPDGRFLGSFSVLFKPETLLGDIIRPVVKGVPLDIWVMDKGGRILYDVDTSQIGLNLFSSPLYQPYQQLITLGRKISKKSQGEGSYRFKAYPSGKDVTKKTYWQSVSLYGTDWRLVAIHLEQETVAERAASPAPSFSSDKALEKFASDTTLATAFSTANKTEMLKLLKKFYDATPGIYSVQWVDVKGVNRSGYPVENSLSEYDFNTLRAASDTETLKILKSQQSGGFEAPLFEGKTGLFRLVPVFKESRYLGMVYTIKLK